MHFCQILADIHSSFIQVNRRPAQDPLRGCSGVAGGYAPETCRRLPATYWQFSQLVVIRPEGCMNELPTEVKAIGWRLTHITSNRRRETGITQP
jgi:hypothetical protein